MNGLDIFDHLYAPYDHEVLAFGEHWLGLQRYKPWQETLIAQYIKPEGSDGQTVMVYGCAGPARFYKLYMLAGTNSVGEPKEAWELDTGSGQHQLVADMAKAISEGMLTCKPPAIPTSGSPE